MSEQCPRLPNRPMVIFPASWATAGWDVPSTVFAPCVCLLLFLLCAGRLCKRDSGTAIEVSELGKSGHERIVWQCNLAYGNQDAWWVDYAQNDNAIIEQAWDKGYESATLCDSWGDPRWLLSFVRMMQLTRSQDDEEDSEERARPIRRIVVTHE